MTLSKDKLSRLTAYDNDVMKLLLNTSSMVDHVVKSLDGNGQPGLLKRMDVMEVTVDSAIKERKAVTDALIESSKQQHADITILAKSVEEIKSCVESHHQDKHAHSLLGQITWKIIVFMILIVALLVVLIPPELNAWDIIKLSLGIH